jgi:hypothetical protein
LVLALLAAPIRAQEFTLDVVSFAAANPSSAGQFSIQSSIGQSDAGSRTVTGDFSLLPGFWNAVTLISPSLSLVRDGSNIVLLWPESTGPDFVLEQADTLTNPSSNITWTAVTATMETTGGFYRATLLLGSGNRFFRLHKP